MLQFWQNSDSLITLQKIAKYPFKAEVIRPYWKDLPNLLSCYYSDLLNSNKGVFIHFLEVELVYNFPITKSKTKTKMLFMFPCSTSKYP